jgi:tRNA(Glu) U13 pseudouridine synthase TruD
MPTKPGLTRREHEELGETLRQLRDEVLRISLQLETAYPKLSPAARLSYKAAQALDRLRSVLDRQAFLDYYSGMRKKRYSLKGRRRTTLTMILAQTTNEAIPKFVI